MRSLRFCLTSEGQQAVLAAIICLLVLQAFLDRTPALQVWAAVLSTMLTSTVGCAGVAVCQVFIGFADWCCPCFAAWLPEASSCTVCPGLLSVGAAVQQCTPANSTDQHVQSYRHCTLWKCCLTMTVNVCRSAGCPSRSCRSCLS